jgi:oligopeptide transport system permease protein
MSDLTTAGIGDSPSAQHPGLNGVTEPSPVVAANEKPRGLLGDAWIDLRRKPLFWISSGFILLLVVMALVPWLFAPGSPTDGDIARNYEGPSAHAWFGYDTLGRDVYARAIYGTRASLIVAVGSTLGTVLFGGLMGVIAGFRGGWVDVLISRVGEIFAGIPFVLGAIVILFRFNGPGEKKGPFAIMGLVIISLVVLTWPVSMRIMRSSVLATKQADYILAARAMGAGPMRIIFKHIVPNCLAPLLVYSTILIGAFIGAEATLSFLGVGLQTPVVSWGIMISEGQSFFRLAPGLLFFPSAFLVIAVLSFVMLGEAVREALDPKLR